MKYLVLIGFLFFSTFYSSQESYKRAYYIPKSKLNLLKTEKEVKFSEFTLAQKDSIRNLFKGFKTISYVTDKVINGKNVKVNITDSVNEVFFNNQVYLKSIKPNRTETVKAFLKFPDDQNKLLINPFINKEDTTNSTYFISLKNRRTFWLPFTEFTVSSLTIPLKYRFKMEDDGIGEEFTSAFNLNFFFGYSYGNTSFMYREKVGNNSNTWKLSGGIVLGASTVELNNSNTSASDNPIDSGNTINQGLVSLGLGGTYSFNKINFGLFYGWDYSLGDTSNKWNYNGLPWLGVGIGYSLFKV